MFKPGETLEVVRTSTPDNLFPVIEIGQKFVCNATRTCPGCGFIGVDIGLKLLDTPVLFKCAKCNAVYPRTSLAALYDTSFFRKLPPPYKLVEVNSEILKQTKKLILS